MRPWFCNSCATLACWRPYESGGPATAPSTPSRYCRPSTVRNTPHVFQLCQRRLTCLQIDCGHWDSNPETFMLLTIGGVVQEFIEQFRVLLPKNATDSRTDVSVLFEKMGLDPTTYQIGKTKVNIIVVYLIKNNLAWKVIYLLPTAGSFNNNSNNNNNNNKNNNENLK